VVVWPSQVHDDCVHQQSYSTSTSSPVYFVMLDCRYAIFV